jgi:aerobic carbon-monoxide dehydrogenase large subunit
VRTVTDMDDRAPPPPASGGGGGGEGGPVPLGGPWAEPLLAVDTVRFVGEPVALVITDGRYQGEDASDMVSVDYDPLPAVVGPVAALTDETLLFPAAGTNVAAANLVSTDDTPFDACEVVVSRDIVNQRVACLPMEGRATAATFSGGKLTVWHSSQNAQLCRLILAGVLGMAPDQIRVVVPDVGGGFGAKVGIDRDAIIVAWAARKTGRALRWAETRSENLVGMTQGRAQLHHVKIGGSRDGRILAYRLDVIQDTGAYPRMGGFLPGLTCLMAPGVYDIPEVQAGFRVAVTNATPISAYRGAGRPEAAAAVERAVDLFAAEIGMDPAEVRRRNFIAPDKFPFQTKTGALYDTGLYAEALDKAMAAADYAGLRREQERRRARGDTKQLGIGLSVYVEITAADAAAGETAKLEVSSDGSATVYTGSSSHGQGHHTAWAMLVQEELGIPMDQVTVIHGDTDLIPVGVGTYASRSLQLGGSAVHKAAIEVRDEARHQVADMLEAAEADVVLDTATGMWQVRGDPDTALSWAQVAGQSSGGSLIADVSFTADLPTFPFGSHVSVVEVDTETGKVTMLRHVTVDDAGPVLNPVLAEGQRHGGIAQGAAQALLEEVLYDADGNPLTSTLADYAAVSAPDLPSFELVDSETPTTLNPLGVKGIGEAGTIGATPAIQNAVIDAVAHLGIRHIDMPTTPQRVWMAINEARKAGNQ